MILAVLRYPIFVLAVKDYSFCCLVALAGTVDRNDCRRSFVRIFACRSALGAMLHKFRGITND